MRRTIPMRRAPADPGLLEVPPMHDVRFSVELARGVPVVAAPKEIDITNAAELRAGLLEAAAHGPGTVVVDMTQTQFCDSAGLHTLLDAHQRAQAEGGERLLVLAEAGVLRIFAIPGIDRVIPNFASLEEALASTPAAMVIHQQPSPGG
jgi:anti-sigma B factor antagonist